MTFEKMVISPSPGLNLIIGPNGAGKSSIIYAIGLGLGASEQILSSTSTLSSYVRHSCDSAKISILLTSNPSFWIIRRISRDNPSEWSIRPLNGARHSISSSDVLERVRALHIQLDNLCMFLPQERVKAFSTLKPPQLLCATEQALNETSYDMHQLLIRDFQQQRERAQRLTDLRSQLAKDQLQIDQLRSDLALFQQAENLRQLIDNHEKKLAWTEYRCLRDERNRLRASYREHVALFEAMNKDSTAAFHEQITALEAQRGSLDGARDAVAKATHLITALSEQSFQIANRLQLVRARLTALDEDRAAAEKKLRQLKQMLEQLQRASQAASAPDALRAEQSRAAEDVVGARTAASELIADRAHAEQKAAKTAARLHDVGERIAALENQKERLLEHVGRTFRREDVVELHRYVRDNRPSFAADVGGPLCVELQFDDPRHANIVHRVVGNRVLFAFGVCDPRDFDAIHQVLQRRRMQQISLLRSRGDARPRPPPPDLARDGFPMYCADLFRAPPFVARMLCALAGLDRIPVGGGRAARDSLPRLRDRDFPSHDISRYVVDDLFYVVYAPRTGGRASTLSMPVGTSRIWRQALAHAGDRAQLEAKRAKLRRKAELLRAGEGELRTRAEQSRAELAAAAQRLQDAKARVAERSRADERVRHVADRVAELQRHCRGIPPERAALGAQLRELAALRMQVCERLLGALRQLADATKALDRRTADDRAILLRIRALRERRDAERAKRAHLEQRVGDLRSQLDAKAALVGAKRREAHARCPRTPANKEMMQGLCGGLEVLAAQLARLRMRHAASPRVDPAVAARLEHAERRRADAQAAIGALQGALGESEAEVRRRFGAWRDELAAEIRKISGVFRELMDACQYRGEVRLEWDEREQIEGYRLSLLVAFDRASPLHVLTAARQSGGEKSVATLLYLLALQDCTRFPFRVVDEINQGMDEVNDRNTFCQVMSYAVRKNQAAQYFLVTPKLLPQIDFLGGVTVLVVMSGPFVPEELDKPITFENAFKMIQCNRGME